MKHKNKTSYNNETNENLSQTDLSFIQIESFLDWVNQSRNTSTQDGCLMKQKLNNMNIFKRRRNNDPHEKLMKRSLQELYTFLKERFNLEKQSREQTYALKINRELDQKIDIMSRVIFDAGYILVPLLCIRLCFGKLIPITTCSYWTIYAFLRSLDVISCIKQARNLAKYALKYDHDVKLVAEAEYYRVMSDIERPHHMGNRVFDFIVIVMACLEFILYFNRIV